MKQGILVVSFGTTYHETRIKNIERIVNMVSEEYKEYAVYQAYSSVTVRRVLRNRDQIQVFDTKEALEAMARDGITQVIVMPTHIIDGIETNKVHQAIRECTSLFSQIITADVLLQKESDYEATAAALWEEIKEEAGNDPVILMGHGSAHVADKSYRKLEEVLRTYAKQEVFIATVEGEVTIEDVIDRLKGSHRQRGRVLLLPFMLVAGDHATIDMAGEKDSFLTMLRQEGYEPECVLRGIGEYEKIRKIYLRHLEEAMEIACWTNDLKIGK